MVGHASNKLKGCWYELIEKLCIYVNKSIKKLPIHTEVKLKIGEICFFFSYYFFIVFYFLVFYGLRNYLLLSYLWRLLWLRHHECEYLWNVHEKLFPFPYSFSFSLSISLSLSLSLPPFLFLSLSLCISDLFVVHIVFVILKITKRERSLLVSVGFSNKSNHSSFTRWLLIIRCASMY